MDPVGPWYASYNRLAGVQAGAASGDFHHHLAGGGAALSGHNPAAGVPSTTSQLLLQAAHTTASLAGQLGTATASPFNPGGFLSPPPGVGYDAVFSPLFHHANPKPAHYNAINAQHRQALAQAQAAAASKQTVDSELTTLRENYAPHHQSLAAAQGSTFFDQTSAPASASGLAWQGNGQLPSPFGILPHESVVPSSPSPAATKPSSAAYENFNVHFAAAQTLNSHLGSQLVNKGARSASPQGAPPAKPVASQPSAPASGSFFQTPATFGSPAENVSSYSTTNAKTGPISSQQEYAAGGKQRANSTAQTSPAASHPSPAPITSPQETTAKIIDKKLTVPVTSAGSSFMASYLKFLQGERDKSPPPATRGGRKATWSRSNTPNNKTFNEQQVNAKAGDQSGLQSQQQNSNGAMPSTGTINASVSMNTPGVLSPAGNIGSPGNINAPGGISSVGVMGSPGAMISPLPSVTKGIDVQDDPRYFSVPKDRKRKFDGTEDGFDPNDDEARRLNKPVLNVPTTPLNEKGKKGRANMNKGPAVVAPPQGTVASKKPRPAVQPPLPAMQAQSHQQYYYQQPDEASDPLMLPQRRETSRRKAKEKSNIAQLISIQGTGDMDDVEEPHEFIDSDTDPAWTPLAKEEEGDEIGVNTSRNKKLKKSRPVVAASRARNRGLSNILSAAAHGAGIDYADYSSEEESSAKKLNQQRTILQTGAIVQQPLNTRPPEEMPYQSGEFVAIKTELIESWPAIWRVDGKALLQKYEPYEQNGKVLYRNISTYAAWNPDSKKLYIQVPVRVRVQNHLESIVELMRGEMSVDDDDFVEKRMQDTSTYQDNFEVYIQTLISHALDPNFLTEIFQEQDEYFLTNVKTVDDITEERRRRIAGAGVAWSRQLEAALGMWPCLGSTELSPATAPICSSCRSTRATQRLQLYGQPYNPATLEPCQPDPRIAYEKDTTVCRLCAGRVELYSRIAHQKYLMFIECNKRVAEKRSLDPHKDTTLILNELLADEPWLSQLFREVRQSWVDAELMERKSRQGVTRQLM